MQLIKSRVMSVCLLAILGSTALFAADADSGDASILGADFIDSALPADSSTELMAVSAGHGDTNKQTLAVKMLAYNQSDSGGIEEVDEDLSVFETVIVYTNKITDKDTIHVRILGDVVSSASMKREHNSTYRSLQSGASGTAYVNLSGGWQHQKDNWTYRTNVGFGAEYAYNSVNIGVGATGELNDKNTTLSVNVQSFFDTVRMIRFNGNEDDDEGRDTLTVELGLTHILTPRSLMTVSVHHSSQSGFLATQFNSVFIGTVGSSTEDFEILPDSRQRTSLTGRYKQAINNDMAYELGLRYYTDDWGIDGETFDSRLFQYIADRSVLLEYHYRYYVQSEADHYQEHFTAAQTYQTSDPDLGDFSGHLIGLKSTFKDRVILGKNGEWDVGVSYYTRDNGLDMMWLTAGFKIGF